MTLNWRPDMAGLHGGSLFAMVKPGMFAKYHAGVHAGVHAGAVAGEEAGPRLDRDLPLAGVRTDLSRGSHGGLCSLRLERCWPRIMSSLHPPILGTTREGAVCGPVSAAGRNRP